VQSFPIHKSTGYEALEMGSMALVRTQTTPTERPNGRRKKDKYLLWAERVSAVKKIQLSR
jgi:hypothetical protein